MVEWGRAASVGYGGRSVGGALLDRDNIMMNLVHDGIKYARSDRLLR